MGNGMRVPDTIVISTDDYHSHLFVLECIKRIIQKHDLKGSFTVKQLYELMAKEVSEYQALKEANEQIIFNKLK